MYLVTSMKNCSWIIHFTLNLIFSFVVCKMKNKLLFIVKIRNKVDKRDFLSDLLSQCQMAPSLNKDRHKSFSIFKSEYRNDYRNKKNF